MATIDHTSAAAATAPLTDALNAMAAALASADLPALLECEPAIARALDAARSGPADREAIEMAQAALLRCRRLGASLVDYTRLTLDVIDAADYSRAGGGVPSPRTGSLEARG